MHFMKAERFMTGLTMGAHFDEDAYGFRRVVAHGDEWMHSRLVHDGVEQRVRVEVRGGISNTKAPGRSGGMSLRWPQASRWQGFVCLRSPKVVLEGTTREIV